MKKLLVGGTHGNEWTGIYLLDYFKKRTDFDSLCLANPKAFEENKRFIDEDLNRCFSKEKIENPNSVYERTRAKDLMAEVEAYDLVLDLHTTTSNMGATVIFCSKSKEVFSLCSYIAEKLPETKFIFNPDTNKQYLISNSKIGLVVEVGPVANSTLNSIVYEQSKNIAQAVADWDQSNKPLPEITYYEYVRTIPYQFDESGKLNSMVHKNVQGKDFKALGEKEALLQDLEGNDIEFDGLSSLSPIFINEAAYYNYEYAMQLVEKKTWTNIF